MTLIKHLPAIQVLLPFFAALFCALTFNKMTSWFIAVISTCINLVIGIFSIPSIKDSMMYVFGNWSAPIGIEYRLDYLNQPIIVYINGVLLFFLVFGKQLIEKTVIAYINTRREHIFYSLILFAHAGYIGVLSTNDIFNFYVFVEISSLSTYVLLSQGNNPKALAGALDYLIMGTIAATLILISIGFLFSITGSLNMSDTFSILQKNINIIGVASKNINVIYTAIAFFFIGVILKMAFFPLHFWMIKSYSASSPIILTYIAAISNIIGIYMIMRFMFYTVGLKLTYTPISIILRFMAIATLISCSYLSLKSQDIKRIIIYSCAVQIGFIFLVLSIWPDKFLLFQLLFVDSINKIGLFTLLAHIENKSSKLNIDSITQIQDSFIFKCLAALLILFSSSLPISSLFILKIMIFDLLLQERMILEFIAIMISSVFGILYNLKLVKAIFFGKEKNGVVKIDTNLFGMVVIVITNVFTLINIDKIIGIVTCANSTKIY